MNAEGDEFSGERVQEILTGLKDQPVAEIVPALLKTIQQYAAGVPQSDDITFLAIRYMGLAAQAGTAKLVMSQLGALRE
jgi:serine phosphatase RsbU (regulator of sigma subunit)